MKKIRIVRLLSMFLCAVILLPLLLAVPFAIAVEDEELDICGMPEIAAALEDEAARTADAAAGTTGTIGDVAKNNQVILLLAPFLQWEDINADTTPRLWKALEEAAIGNLNARSRVKEADGAPSLAEGALTISAGTWPRVAHQALPAFQAGDMVGGAFVSDAYSRYLDGNMGDNQIAYLGLPRNIAANARNPFVFVPGTLGSLIEDAGGATVALGSSDMGHSGDASRQLRPAAIAAMNRDGMVRYGTINEAILEHSAQSPYGVRTDLETMRAEIIAARRSLDADKPGLIVIDSGDGYRARMFASEVAPEVAHRQWTDSLATLDAIYVDVRDIFPDAVVIVASQATRSITLDREGFGPIIITGPDITPGLLTSDSTHREGLVIAGDITATILRIMGLPHPVHVIGCEMYVADRLPPLYSPPDKALYQTSLVEQRDVHLDLLMRMSDTAISIEATRVNVITACIYVTVVVLLLGALVVTFGDRRLNALTVRGAKGLIYALILAVLSGPVASWLMFLIHRWPATPQEAITQFALTTAGVWAIAVGLWIFDYSRRGKRLRRSAGDDALVPVASRLPLIFISVVTTVVIVGDQLLGAPASFASFFGYSPIAAFRFYGIGNEGAAILMGSVFVGFALILDSVREAGYTKLEKHIRIWVIPIVGVFITFVGASPLLGASNGFTPFSVAGFSVFWILANDKKITWKSVLAILATIAAFVLAFMALDHFTSGQTHLIRSVDSAAQGGIIEIWHIIVRKAETSWRVLTTSTHFSIVFAALLAFLVYMRLRPAGDFKLLLARNKYFGDAIAAVLVCGIAAVLSNDSGIVLPALMVLCLASSMVWLMLDPVTGLPADNGKGDGCIAPNVETSDAVAVDGAMIEDLKTA